MFPLTSYIMTISGHATITRQKETRLIDKKLVLDQMTKISCEIVKVRLVGVGMFTLSEGDHYCAGWKVEFASYKGRADVPDMARKVRTQFKNSMRLSSFLKSSSFLRLSPKRNKNNL